MIDPRVIIKANYNRTLVTIRVTAIDSPDWPEIVGSRIELSRNSTFTDIFYTNSTTHYKVRAYLENPTPNQTVYGRVTLTKNDNTTLQKTFNFVTPYPVIGTVVSEDGTEYITSIRKMDKNGNLSPRDYTNKAVSAGASHIDIVADEAGEMIVSNQWTTPVLVQNITQGTAQVELAGNNRSNSTTVAVDVGDIVRVTEGTENVTFRAFATSGSNPLCKGVSAHISVMPSTDKFTVDEEGTKMPNFFFAYFNSNGTLTSLPEGSFDFHKIRTTGQGRGDSSNYAFSQFNYHGALTSLPEGSFDFSNIATERYGFRPGHYVFYRFNSYGALTSLPEGSFDFDNIQFIEGVSSVFSEFNKNGALTSLPEGSFGFSSLNDDYAGNLSFSSFNEYGLLTSLPAGAFHYRNGATIGTAPIFGNFNAHGALTSLPEHSFNFLLGGDNVRVGGFGEFNSYGALTSLPEGSFRFTGTNLKLYNAFSSFNNHGALTSLPEGSFNTENVVQDDGGQEFAYFNAYGALVSLPEGSFKFNNLTKVNYDFCNCFNQSGSLKTLPKGSFNFESLTTAKQQFCSNFNRNGALEYLPIDSFSVNALTSVYQITDQGWNVFGYFNYYGKLTKSDTDYNPNFIFPTASQPVSQTAYYYNPTTQGQYTETVSRGNPFKYYEADYFSVSHELSPAYILTIEDEYLSGQTVTFMAVATDQEEYEAIPSIVTEGGTTIAVADNGDNTFTFTMPKDEITVSVAVRTKPAKIVLVAEEAGDMVIYNKWAGSVILQNTTQETAPVTLGASQNTTIAVNADDEVTVTESSANVFRRWRRNDESHGLATGVLCHIKSMPKMEKFVLPNTHKFEDEAFNAFCAGSNGKGITSLPDGSFDISEIELFGSSVFAHFNYYGLLTSLPAGSFDTSNVLFTAQNGSGAFSYFNLGGALTSLPAGSFHINPAVTVAPARWFGSFNQSGELVSLPDGSFNIDNVAEVYLYAFDNFNQRGKLTSLPTGSFNTGNITTIKTSYFFSGFNGGGALTSLPAGSFNIDNIQGDISAYSNFFASFNANGALTSLPAGSFNTSNITKVGSSFFSGFNSGGALASLPAGSFDISNITQVGDEFFRNFNYNGALTSLPAGSFDTSEITGEVNVFFASFNADGALTSLPAGSFDISNITSFRDSCFASFNYRGQLTSLPAGSFDTSGATSVGGGFARGFNSGGALASLPAGSFDTSNITTFGGNCFYEFNYQGQLVSLPAGSFDLSGTTSVGEYFCYGFNRNGALTSLPAGSFNISNLTSIGRGFMGSFNYDGGKLETLPVGSFSTRGLTLPAGAFSAFNQSSGRLQKDTNSYNPDFINSTSNTLNAYYYDPATGGTTSTAVAVGDPFYYKTA